MRKIIIAFAGFAALVMTARPAHAVFSPYLTAMSVGGGVSQFTRSSIRDEASTQGAWDFRLLIGTRSPVAFEAAYQGASGIEHADGIGSDPTLLSTSVTGNLRVNLTKWRVQPFLLGGVGWINFHSYGRDDAPVAADNFSHSANGVTVPMGGGLASYIGKNTMIDARGMYNLNSDVKDFVPGQEHRPDTWAAELRLGYAF